MDFTIITPSYNYGHYIGSTSCFYRRETTIVEGHLLDIDFGFCMGGEYYARLASLEKRFAYCPQVLADLRLHGESISQKSRGKDDIKNVLRMQRQAAEQRPSAGSTGSNSSRTNI